MGKYDYEIWYDADAKSVIIQAIGRGRRHRDDYCLVIGCDERFDKFFPDKFGKANAEWNPETFDKIETFFKQKGKVIYKANAED